jgi:hypothetical protein
MANESVVCVKYPDIFEIPGPDLSEEERRKITERNERNARIYAGVKAVLEKDFGIKTMPPDPQQFPGTLQGKNLSQVTAILGIIQADNWEDPANGKTLPNADDILVNGKVIDRRFVDAVVEAVKEYTAASDLYNNVYTLMVAEASEGSSPARPPTSTKS